MDAATRETIRALVEAEKRRRAFARGVRDETVVGGHVPPSVEAENAAELERRAALAARYVVRREGCEGTINLGPVWPGARCSRRARYIVGARGLCGTHRRIALHGRGRR